MTEEIRILHEDDYMAFARIAAQAFPGMDLRTPAQFDAFVENRLHKHPFREFSQLVGLFRGGVLLGGMRVLDYTMNIAGQLRPIGGVGMVSVGQLHKRQGVARELIAHFCRHYRAHGSPVTALYPFRPDFYGALGYGHGTPLHSYRLAPQQFPDHGDRGGLVLLGAGDAAALGACYQRCFAATHGLFARRSAEIARVVEDPENTVVGVLRDGVLRGYLVFQHRPDGDFTMNIEIRELLYEDRAAFFSLCAYLSTQRDQFRTILFHTQEAGFHHLLHDPRDGSGRVAPHAYHASSTTGVGLMYRISGLGQFFTTQVHPAWVGGNVVRFNVHDRLLAEHTGAATVRFADSQAALVDAPAACTVTLDVAAFSSLALGVVSLRRLHAYGKAEIDDEQAIAAVDRLFTLPDPPVCVTRF